jgi:hypothetical protein
LPGKSVARGFSPWIKISSLSGFSQNTTVKENRFLLKPGRRIFFDNYVKQKTPFKKGALVIQTIHKNKRSSLVRTRPLIV